MGIRHQGARLVSDDLASGFVDAALKKLRHRILSDLEITTAKLAFKRLPFGQSVCFARCCVIWRPKGHL